MDLVTAVCSLMGLLAFVQNLIPPKLREFLDRWLQDLWEWLFKSSDPFTYVDVPENVDGAGFAFNLFYREVGVYLGSLKTSLANQRVNVYRPDETSSLVFSLPIGETLEDNFEGAQLWWTHSSTEKGESKNEERSFSLKMFKSDRARLLSEYFHHVSTTAAQIERLNTQRHLYTNNHGAWEQVLFNHPSSFDTLALEPDLKDRIKADLKAFSEGEDFYHRIGRAWKRGYLLYGPPGTGKSSMIAAMANFLHYDIYDLELTKVYDNSDLKSLLIQTSKKSIIVIEDIDCSLDLSDRASKGDHSATKTKDKEDEDDSHTAPDPTTKVTLSGLLNFTDGLWSCCGEERIFIFTTNHKDRLDPALLRSGRMDFHILLSYCTFPAFKILASNYLGIKDHVLYAELEGRMKSETTKITPADIGELLISNKDNPEVALQRIIAALDQVGAGKAQGESANELIKGGLPKEIEQEKTEQEKPARRGRLQKLRFLVRLKK